MSKELKKNQCELWAPHEFWQLPEHIRKSYRCGPGRGALELLVPDVWYFGWPLVKPIRITPACSIHDYMYEQGPSEIWWKDKADRVFLNNMIRLIEAFPAWPPIIKIRFRKAQAYYRAVKLFGGPAFWSGRNRPEDLHDECVVSFL